MWMHFQFLWRHCSLWCALFILIFILRLRSHQYAEMTSIFNERIFSDFNLLCCATTAFDHSPRYTHRLDWVCQSKWVEWWNINIRVPFVRAILFIFEIEKKTSLYIVCVNKCPTHCIMTEMISSFCSIFQLLWIIVCSVSVRNCFTFFQCMYGIVLNNRIFSSRQNEIIKWNHVSVKQFGLQPLGHNGRVFELQPKTSNRNIVNPIGRSIIIIVY